MRDVGGLDYPQNVHREYKKYLRAQGLVNLPCRATMSKYFWLANKMGLIVFDHAETPAYWDAVVEGIRVTKAYRREPRPRAPSPRHYYRIIDADDSRWERLEVSYRESIGIPAPPRLPRPPVEVRPLEEVEAAVEKPKRPPRPKKPKVVKAPKVTKPKPVKTSAEVAAPFEARIKTVVEGLDLIKRQPTVQVADTVREELEDISGELLEALEAHRGAVRDRLLGINTILIAALDHWPAVQSALDNLLAAKTSTLRARWEGALAAAIRVVKEDLQPPPPKEEEKGGR